jgi:multicomponent Na+:H+ antiporter subunit B
VIRNLASLLFAGGLLFFLMVLVGGFDLGQSPMLVGQGVQASAQDEVGAANFVTSVVLAYRGFDTLGELSILFAAAAAAGLVLGRAGPCGVKEPEGGFVLRSGADLLFPLLLMVGFYIIVHGHLTPGGGFQGGVILAAAFFIPLLARPSEKVNHLAISLIEGLAGATFIGIGLIALFKGQAFLQPMLDHGQFGTLLSAGTLPFLYMAVGLKVGAELAGLLARIADAEEGQA